MKRDEEMKKGESKEEGGSEGREVYRKIEVHLALFTGHSQILSHSHGEKSGFLHSCKLESGSGLESRLRSNHITLPVFGVGLLATIHIQGTERT